MKRSGIAVGISVDQRAAGLWFTTGGEPASDRYRFDADAVDDIIGRLQRVRAEMLPAVPEDVEFTEVEILADEAWRIAPGQDGTGRVVAIRHPGLGWLAFGLNEEHARRLAAALL